MQSLSTLYTFWHVVSYRWHKSPAWNIKLIGQGVRGLRLPKIGGFPLTCRSALTCYIVTSQVSMTNNGLTVSEIKLEKFHTAKSVLSFATFHKW